MSGWRRLTGTGRLRVPSPRRQELLLGAQHLGAVDRREHLAALDPLARLGDHELLNPTRKADRDLGETALVGRDDTDRAQSVAEGGALDLRRSHPDELDALGRQVDVG